MDVKAVILVGGARTEGSEQLGGVPLAFLDVLGEPVLQRVIDRLEKFGVSGTAVITEAPVSAAPLARGSLRPGLHWAEATGTRFWRAAENAFNEFAQNGSELVLVIRLGPYAEIDYEELVQFHLDKRSRATKASDGGAVVLDTFVISASRRNDAAYLFRHELQEMRVPCDAQYSFAGYVNRLETAADLRILALDGFAGIANVEPRGTEVKPGVWVGDGACVDRNARLLAPCFVGAHAKIRAAALLTRGSVAEHHAAIDCGTVVENSTVLPATTVGAGLDVTQSVLGFRRIWNLRRSVEVEISDTHLVGVMRSAPVRLLAHVVNLAGLLSKHIAQTLPGQQAAKTSELREAVNRPAAALEGAECATEDGLAASDLLPVRRYGDE